MAAQVRIFFGKLRECYGVIRPRLYASLVDSIDLVNVLLLSEVELRIVRFNSWESEQESRTQRFVSSVRIA